MYKMQVIIIKNKLKYKTNYSFLLQHLYNVSI